MRFILCLSLLLLLLLLARATAAGPTTQPRVPTTRPDFGELDPHRVALIATWLPERPAGSYGQPITDRAYWTAPATQARVGDSIALAEQLLGSPLPPWDDDAYLEFSRNGQRPRGEAMMQARYGRLLPLVIAECLENKGRFLPSIHEALTGYCDQPTWTHPAHDGGLNAFSRKSYAASLTAANHAADMAQALWLLGDRLEPAVRERSIAAIRERVVLPLRRSVVTGRGHAWLGSAARPVQNNWNAVTLAGTVYAALIVEPRREDRAFFVAAAEHHVRYFLNGMRESGFCDEGGGYWAYGFGAFCQLREALVRQTGGRIELFDLPRAAEAAQFGRRYQLTSGLVPNFADSRNGAKADVGLIAYCDVALGLGGDASQARLWSARLHAVLAEPTPVARSRDDAPAPRPLNDDALRSYFDDVGVLICRPTPGGESSLALAVKAGGNSSHSHNDVGSYVLSLGDQLVLGDPGGPLHYDNRSFTDRRYERTLLNSYGHPVPVIGGKLQRNAAAATPKVIARSFAPEQDEITIDLTSAYDVPALRAATRRVTYTRGGRGEATVTDRFQLDRPTAVEVALTTLGRVEVLGPTRLRVTSGGSAVQVDVKGPPTAAPKVETFDEMGVTFSRIGLTLAEPTRSAEVKFTIRPE